MLDLPRLERINLTARPRVQRAVALMVLMPNYNFAPGVDIVFEGQEKLPDHPVIFAMNHTDRYNYFPFMYTLWRKQGRFMAVWVKGKYYENPFIATFMELTNNIPTVSRGYILTKDFSSVTGRTPRDDEYRALRRWIEQDLLGEGAAAKPQPGSVPDEILVTPREMLGRYFDPARETYAEAVNALFGRMMRRFVEINAQCFEKDLDLLIFPEGTRSIHLSRGHIGISEIALKFQQPIVPVGCSGSDKVYPGGSPIGKKGRIVYRFGEEMSYASMKQWHVDEDYEPFTAEAEKKHRDKFQGLADEIMERINDLVDDDYKFKEDGESTGVKGAARFV